MKMVPRARESYDGCARPTIRGKWRRNSLRGCARLPLYLLLILAMGPGVASRSWLWVSTGPPNVVVCPGQAALLECIINVGRPPLKLDDLRVVWRCNGQTVLKFDEVVTAWRSGAIMLLDDLKEGNASLVLYEVDDSDCGRYTCGVRYHREKRQVSLKLRLREVSHCPRPE